jgi:hypothetical protein
MRILFVIIGIIIGVVLAWILNKFLGDRIKDKGQRIGLKVAAYFLCIVFGLAIVLLGSLRTTLDRFIDNRIKNIEVLISKNFPDSNILDINININEFASASDELQKALNYVDISNDGFLEKLTYDVFIKRYTNYVYGVKTGIDTVVTMSDDTGSVTAKSILYNLKDMALDTVSRYFKYGQIGIIVLFFIFISIYIGIVFLEKKGNGMYNKSIVYGEINYNNDNNEYNNKE